MEELLHESPKPKLVDSVQNFAVFPHTYLLPLCSLPWLALITLYWVHHDLVWITSCVVGISLAPVVTDSVSEDVAVSIEARG